MPTATVTSKGQVTLPKKVREALKIGPGDQIDFVVEGDGRVSVRPVHIDFTERRGLLHRRGMKPVSLDEMDAAIVCGRIRNGGERASTPTSWCVTSRATT
jgi:AbrB family looped-hinge helix DNA binding protein